MFAVENSCTLTIERSLPIFKHNHDNHRPSRCFVLQILNIYGVDIHCWQISTRPTNIPLHLPFLSLVPFLSVAPKNYFLILDSHCYFLPFPLFPPPSLSTTSDHKLKCFLKLFPHNPTVSRALSYPSNPSSTTFPKRQPSAT